MDPYVELDFFTDPTSPWWSHQTAVKASAGKEAEWQIDQSVPLSNSTSVESKQQQQDKGGSSNSLRVRVKDKNSIRKDVLIGKGVVTLEELMDQSTGGEWSSRTVQIKNKKGKVSGEVVLTTRYRQPSASPPASASPASSSTLSTISQSSDLNPIFLISLQRSVYDPAILSRKERLERICLKYGVAYQESSPPSLASSGDLPNDHLGLEEGCILMLSAATAAPPGAVPVVGGEKRHTLLSLLECAKELQSLQPMPLVSSPSSPVSALV
jgi:hypothetical protein